MSWIRVHRYTLGRRSVQAGILLLFWLGAHQHLGVLTGNLSGATVFGRVPLSDPYAVLQILATGHALAATALIGALIVLGAYFVIGGRAFCAWVCPVNPVTDLARNFRSRIRPSGRLPVDRQTRFWIMGLALVVSAITQVAAFEWVSPIGLTHREIIFGPGLGLLAVGGILLLDLYVLRDGWCSVLCPLGAFYSLVGRRSIVRVDFDPARCDRCGDCVPACPEPRVLRFEALAASGFIDSGDCLNCGRCLEVCARDAFHFGLRFRRPRATDHEGGDRNAN